MRFCRCALGVSTRSAQPLPFASGPADRTIAISTFYACLRPAGPLIVVTALTAGRGHTCALGADGVAFCWGLNAKGQLGIGNNTDAPSPARVALAQGARRRPRATL